MTRGAIPGAARWPTSRPIPPIWSAMCVLWSAPRSPIDEALLDAALLRVAYDAGCRRSELVAILVQHIEKDAEAAGTLFIPSSKTDHAGEGGEALITSRRRPRRIRPLIVR